MAKVNLCILEVPIAEFKKLNYWDALADTLGSNPRLPGEVVEGMTVPEEKVWLFPLGNDFKRVEKVITGVRKIYKVNV